MSRARDGTAQDDMLASIEARYRALEAKIRAVHDAKMQMARAALKALARDGKADADGARRAKADAEIVAVERSLDEALVTLAKDKAEDIEVVENARRTERDAAEVTRRYVEEERARALAASAKPAPEVLRAQVNAEEAEVYDEADDYRSRSPEGTSPRATTTEAAADAPAVKSSGLGLMNAVRTLLQTKKGSASELTVDAAAEKGNDGRKKVNMAALAPKPAMASRASISALAPTPVATDAPAPMLVVGEDPHGALVQRLRSAKIDSSSSKAREDAPAAEPKELSARRQVVRADAPRKNIDAPSRPQPVAQTVQRLDSTRPRGLGAAVKDIVENPSTSTSRRRDTIENAFGVPKPRDATLVPPQAVYGGNAAAFAPEPVVRRKFVPLPAAPIRSEPNPYVMSQEDVKQAHTRRRVGFEENVPQPNGTYATPVQAQRTHTGSPMIEVVGSTGPPARVALPARAPQTSNQLASTRSDVDARAFKEAADASDAIDSDANEDESLQPVVLKPKIPRSLVQPQRFKMTEMRNLFSFARHGRYNQMKDLLNKGVPIDARDENGNSALIIACQNGQGRLVKLLVRSGADPNMQNKRGNTALHFAVLFKFDVIADFVIKHGARTDIRNVDGLTCYEFIG